MVDRYGNALGSVCVVDVKPRSISNEAVEGLSALARNAMAFIEVRHASEKLSDTLSQLKEASSLLPICCHCKAIRDDENYWQRVEDYIKKSSLSEFTHGICPDCLEKHHSMPHGDREEAQRSCTKEHSGSIS